MSFVDRKGFNLIGVKCRWNVFVLDVLKMYNSSDSFKLEKRGVLVDIQGVKTTINRAK
jgi:hypothetical protein